MLITPCTDLTKTDEFIQIERSSHLVWTPDDDHIYERLVNVIS